MTETGEDVLLDVFQIGVTLPELAVLALSIQLPQRDFKNQA